MRSVYINLKKGKLVHEFVKIINQLNGSFTLQAGLATLDAKSILGIYTQDLSAPLLLQIECDSAENLSLLEPFFWQQTQY